MAGSDDHRRPRQARRGSLSEALTADTIVCGDSGTVAVFVARQIQLRRGQQFSFSGTICSMAAALPYAIGAQSAVPDRQVVAFTGDSSRAHMTTTCQCRSP